MKFRRFVTNVLLSWIPKCSRPHPQNSPCGFYYYQIEYRNREKISPLSIPSALDLHTLLYTISYSENIIEEKKYNVSGESISKKEVIICTELEPNVRHAFWSWRNWGTYNMQDLRYQRFRKTDITHINRCALPVSYIRNAKNFIT
jgi:hypothetical protein